MNFGINRVLQGSSIWTLSTQLTITQKVERAVTIFLQMCFSIVNIERYWMEGHVTGFEQFRLQTELELDERMPGLSMCAKNLILEAIEKYIREENAFDEGKMRMLCEELSTSLDRMGIQEVKEFEKFVLGRLEYFYCDRTKRADLMGVYLSQRLLREQRVLDNRITDIVTDYFRDHSSPRSAWVAMQFMRNSVMAHYAKIFDEASTILAKGLCGDRRALAAVFKVQLIESVPQPLGLDDPFEKEFFESASNYVIRNIKFVETHVKAFGANLAYTVNRMPRHGISPQDMSWMEDWFLQQARDFYASI